MRRPILVAVLAMFLGSCTPASQERVRDYSLDGVELFKKGDYAHARETFQAALELQPGDANLLFNMAQCSERLGQYSKAEQQYQQCLQIAPNHAECRLGLTALLVRENRRPEAMKMVEGWLASQPRLASAYAVDGWLWRQAGDLPRAQSRLQQALALDRDDNLALTEMAQVYEAMNRPDRAYVLYEHSLEVRPNQPEIRDRLTSLKKQGANRPHPD